MSDFQQCNCKSGEWQGQLCDICNGTGNAAIASMQGEYEPVGNYLVERLKSSNTCYNWINRQNQEAAAEIARLQKLSVTNILLEISPGFDGMGDEIYAKSVEDVYKAMAKLETKIDDQRGEIAKLQKELEEARKDAERWEAICNLWFLCSELKLIQNEDGGYSICEMEFVDNLLVSDFCGDTPEQAIDAAISKIGGGE